MLIPKKNKNLLFLTNWRPLTLLNNDYKILSKALAIRLQSVMDHIISEEQSGFMKGRYIGENLFTLQSLIEHLHNTGQERLLLSIDKEKAFDTVNHEALWAALDHFNFGPRLCGYIQILYSHSRCAVTSNGWISDYFQTDVGVKQGDPISSFLFLIIIEILNIMLKLHVDLEPTQIGTASVLMGQFADDIWNVIRDDIQQLQALMYVYDQFYLHTGLKINYDKTEIMRIGSLSNTEAKCYSLLQLKWTSGPISILGIDIYNNVYLMAQKNFLKFKQKFEDKLKSWRYRGLSLLGQILVVNTLLVSQLVYKMMMVCMMTQEQYKEFKAIILEFLWEGRKPKIAYSKLILPYSKGGLKLHNIMIRNKAMRLAWIPKMLNESNWANLMQSFLPIPTQMIFKCNISAKHVDVLGINNRLIKEIVKCWAELNLTIPKNRQQVLNQILWFNSASNTNRWLYYPELSSAGINTVENIYNTQLSRFCNCLELNQQYSVTVQFMQIFSVIKSIPHNWKVHLRSNESVDNEIKMFSTIQNQTKISRMLYWEYIDRSDVSIQGSRLLSSQDFNKTFTEKEWEKISCFPFRITLSTKLRLFQYKITQRCLVTNINLFYYGIKDTKNCTFCNNHNETIIHLFWECHVVQRFWKQVF